MSSPLNGRRDRTKRSTSGLKRLRRTPSERRVRTMRRSAGRSIGWSVGLLEILAIPLQPGYRSISLVRGCAECAPVLRGGTLFVGANVSVRAYTCTCTPMRTCMSSPGRCIVRDVRCAGFGNARGSRRAFILRDRTAQDRCALSRQKDCRQARAGWREEIAAEEEEEAEEEDERGERER